MKRKITTIMIVVALIAAAAVSSCKKSEEEKKTSLLSSGRFTLTRYEFHKKDGTWDYYVPNGAVSLEFRDDKTVTAIVLGSSSIRTWVLSGDQSQLTISRVGGGADTYNILQLSSSALQLSPIGDPSPYTEERDTYAR